MILLWIDMMESNMAGEWSCASTYLHCLWIQPPASRSGTWHQWSSAWWQMEKRLTEGDHVSYHMARGLFAQVQPLKQTLISGWIQVLPVKPDINNSQSKCVQISLLGIIHKSVLRLGLVHASAYCNMWVHWFGICPVCDLEKWMSILLFINIWMTHTIWNGVWKKRHLNWQLI